MVLFKTLKTKNLIIRITELSVLFGFIYNYTRKQACQIKASNLSVLFGFIYLHFSSLHHRCHHKDLSVLFGFILETEDPKRLWEYKECFQFFLVLFDWLKNKITSIRNDLKNFQFFLVLFAKVHSYGIGRLVLLSFSSFWFYLQTC